MVSSPAASADELADASMSAVAVSGNNADLLMSVASKFEFSTTYQHADTRAVVPANLRHKKARATFRDSRSLMVPGTDLLVLQTPALRAVLGGIAAVSGR